MMAGGQGPGARADTDVRLPVRRHGRARRRPARRTHAHHPARDGTVTDAERRPRQVHAELAHWRGAIASARGAGRRGHRPRGRSWRTTCGCGSATGSNASIAALSRGGPGDRDALASGRPVGEAGSGAAAAAALPRGRDRARVLRRRGAAADQPRASGPCCAGWTPSRSTRWRSSCARWAWRCRRRWSTPRRGSAPPMLRAGIRLWDHGGLSPVAAIKVTRHNLDPPDGDPARDRPPVAPPDGWNAELGDGAAPRSLAPRSTYLARRAVAVLGGRGRRRRGRLRAGRLGAGAGAGQRRRRSDRRRCTGSASATRTRPSWLRVLFNVELCRQLVRRRPLGRPRRGWRARHDPAGLSAATRRWPGRRARCCRRSRRPAPARPFRGVRRPAARARSPTRGGSRRTRLARAGAPGRATPC